MPTVHVLNGPNLNLLGTRKPEVYGRSTLADVERLCQERADELGLELRFRQTNHEGVLVDWVHECGHEVRAGASIGAVINPGALAHTSIALRDAIEGVEVPVVEVHISNVHAREPFRHHSHISAVVRGIVIGLGVRGYPMAMTGLHRSAGDTRSG